MTDPRSTETKSRIPAWATGLRSRFEEWVTTVRVMVDLTRQSGKREHGYQDKDIDWLWDAFKEGAKSAMLPTLEQKLERLASGVKLRDGFPRLTAEDAKEILAALQSSGEPAPKFTDMETMLMAQSTARLQEIHRLNDELAKLRQPQEPRAEPVAWFHSDFGSIELSRVQRVGWKPLYAQLPAAEPAGDVLDMKLPCEVRLPPATTFGVGVSLRTVVHALRRRTAEYPLKFGDTPDLSSLKSPFQKRPFNAQSCTVCGFAEGHGALPCPDLTAYSSSTKPVKPEQCDAVRALTDHARCQLDSGHSGGHDYDNDRRLRKVTEGPKSCT